MAKPLYEIKRPTEMNSYKALSNFFQEEPIKGNNEKNRQLKEEQLERFRQFYDIKVREKPKKIVYTVSPKNYQSKNSKLIAIKAEKKAQWQKQNIQDTIIIDSKEYPLDNPKRIIKDYFYPYVVTLATHAKVNSKSDFYTLLFYPSQFYQYLYKVDSSKLYSVIHQYDLEALQVAEQEISARLFKIVDYQIKKMIKQNIIHTEYNFRDNEGNFIEKSLIDKFDREILKENNWSSVGAVLQYSVTRAKLFKLRNKYYSNFVGESRYIKQEFHIYGTDTSKQIIADNPYGLEGDLEKQLYYLESYLTYMRQRLIFLVQTKAITNLGIETVQTIPDKIRHGIAGPKKDSYTMYSIKAFTDLFTCRYEGVNDAGDVCDIYNVYKDPNVFCSYQMYDEYDYKILRNMTYEKFYRVWNSLRKENKDGDRNEKKSEKESILKKKKLNIIFE